MLRPWKRRRSLAVATVLASLAHAWLLGLWPMLPLATTSDTGSKRPLPVNAGPAASAVRFEVRQIVVAAAPAASPLFQATPSPQPAGTARREAPAQPPGHGARATTDASRPAPPSHRNGEPSPSDGQIVPKPAPVEAASPAVPTRAAAPATYRAAPPAAATLLYDVRRGGAAGAASLTWSIDSEGRYALELQGRAAPPAGPAQGRATVTAGAALAPHWTSHGRLDAAGIAPERFAVSRRGRERHAANFRRAAGIVSFAGSARTWPLLAGAQDRLSWMVQLAAVLRAEPALAAAGRQISMMVVGAHGDAGIWTFTVQGLEEIEGPSGEPLRAWRLTREAAQAYDPHVQVWAAPDLQHWPVRMTLTLPQRGESTEFRLRALQAP